LIRADHVIVDMVRGLGAVAEPRRCAFDPEAGAYEDGAPHHHHDDHDHHDAAALEADRDHRHG
jgi:urease accessory protein